jgi:hypothetical protein
MSYFHRAEAEKFFGPYFGSIHAVIIGADDDYKAHYAPAAKVVHDASCRAKNRSCHMVDRANKLAATIPNKVRPFQSEGLLGIVIEERAALIFKKFDSDLRTRNNPTDHMEKFLQQVPLEGIDALHNFVAGYTEDPVTGALNGTYLVYPKGRGNNYVIPISDNRENGAVEDLFKPEPAADQPPPLRPKTQPGEVVRFPKRKDDEPQP